MPQDHISRKRAVYTIAGMERANIRKDLVYRIGEFAPLLVDHRARRGGERLSLALIELSGAAFEDDLLLLGTAQRQPPEHSARDEHGE